MPGQSRWIENMKIRGRITKIEETADGLLTTIRYWHFSDGHYISLFMAPGWRVGDDVDVALSIERVAEARPPLPPVRPTPKSFTKAG